MHSRALTAFSLVVAASGLILVGALGHLSPASAQETPQLQEAVEQVLTKLAKNKKGLRPGITNSQAAKAARGASQITGGFMLSLKSTPYAPDGDWHGVVSFYADLEEPREKLDDIELALLCGTYDKKKMERWLLDVAGPKLGLALEPDDDEKYLYWDPDAKKRDIWISLGDDVIQFNCADVED